eukprot:1429211-Amphidinium_carterae.1
MCILGGQLETLSTHRKTSISSIGPTLSPDHVGSWRATEKSTRSATRVRVDQVEPVFGAMYVGMDILIIRTAPIHGW